MESKLNPLLQGYLFITPEQQATSSLLSVCLTLITMSCPFFTAKSSMYQKQSANNIENSGSTTYKYDRRN